MPGGVGGAEPQGSPLSQLRLWLGSGTLRLMPEQPTQLSPPVDLARDHLDGPDDPGVTLLEYGDYQCGYCQQAHAGIRRIREQHLPGQVRYVFRHLPNTRLHPDAQRAAEAAEAAAAQGRFWDMHDYMFAHQDALDRDSLVDAAATLGLDQQRFARELDDQIHAPRVRADMDHAQASGVHVTPTFFIDGRRYDGPWDDESVLDTMRRPLGGRVRQLAEDFAGLSASAGFLMLLGAVVALVWANSPWAASYTALWNTELAVRLGRFALPLSLHQCINDGLIVFFFFVVTLEIKREITVGQMSEPRRAALPLAAAAGGMLAPVVLYSLFNWGGAQAMGWGVPMATDTAFALGIMAMLGSRVPLALKVFVAALAIADDMGAILVLALFYTTDIAVAGLVLAALCFAAALALNRARVYRPLPYALAGIALWSAVYYSGLHTTLAGVLLAVAIPTRSPPNTPGLHSQSTALFDSLQAPPVQGNDQSRYQATVRALEALVGRLLSPAQRLERDLRPWSSYLILPLFALANAGIAVAPSTLDFLQPVSLGVIVGLVIGKPLGITLATWLAVRAGLADQPTEFSWRQVAGAGALCGIGFTMSIFIADAAFADSGPLALAKVSVMVACVLAAGLGWWLLRGAPSPSA